MPAMRILGRSTSKLLGACVAFGALACLAVVEDEGVRIDEMRIRGEVRSINVQSKLRGSPPYEVLVRPRGRDPSQDAGAAGRSVWSLLSF